MRSIDLALYADALAAEAAAVAGRLERARGLLRRAAIEQEARLSLRPEIVARLERLGALAKLPAEGLGGEIADAQLDLRVLEALQAWVEAQLARRSPASDPSAEPAAAGRKGTVLTSEPVSGAGESLVKEAAMRV